MKRFLSLLTVFALLLSFASPVLAAEAGAEAEGGRSVVRIGSVQDFLAFAESCAETGYSEKKIFTLTCNLDLGGRDFSPVPYFAGEFRGGGHSITGLNITHDGSRQGLFRTVAAGAVISELHVSGTVTPGGSRSDVGGIAGRCEGTLEGCRFEGVVAGRENVGGLCGCLEERGRITGCRVSGSVTGEHFAGGVCGLSGGLIDQCVSEAAVNTTEVIPERQEHIDLSDFDFSSLSSDSYLDVTDIGGVCGKSTGVISRSENLGNVGYTRLGYNVGGVCGLSSGYVSRCVNAGEVRGRRDVGGIVGQLAPNIELDFSDGKLEDIKTALQGLNWSIASASNDVKNRGREAAAELDTLSSRSQALEGELRALLEQLRQRDENLCCGFRCDPETGEITFEGWKCADASAFIAALAALLGEYDVILRMTKDHTGELMQKLLNVASSVSALMGQLNRAMETDGVLVNEVDLSVSEGYDHEQGAVDGSVNRGAVYAEECAGGVAGSVGYELDFDKEELTGLSDALSAEIKEYIFAVLRECESYGSVEAKNSYAGGTVGKAELGAVLDCVASGSLSSLSGDWVGGIAGKTAGTVKGCYARPVLSGGAFVGGVAGEAEIVRDCCVYAVFEGWSEYAGALAGRVNGEISGCTYVRCTPAGVDGVSHTGQMNAVSYEELLSRDSLPEVFRAVTVRFIGPDGTECASVSPDFGGAVTELPEIGRDGERYWRWDSEGLDCVCRDMEIRGAYYNPVRTLSTGEDIPLFLVEGSFYEGQELTVTSADSDTEEGRFTVCRIEVSGYEGKLTVRMLAEEPGRVLLCASDGTRQELVSSADGRYRVFTIRNGESVTFEPGAERQTSFLLPVSLTAGAVLLLLLLRRKRKSSLSPAAGGDGTEDGGQGGA